MSVALLHIATASVTHRHGVNSYMAAGVTEAEAQAELLEVLRREFCDAWWGEESRWIGCDSSDGLSDKEACEKYFEAVPDETCESSAHTVPAYAMLKLAQRALEITDEPST